MPILIGSSGSTPGYGLVFFTLHLGLRRTKAARCGSILMGHEPASMEAMRSPSWPILHALGSLLSAARGAVVDGGIVCESNVIQN